MLIVFLTNRKDYEPFLADVVFAFDGLENFGWCESRISQIARILFYGGERRGRR